MSAAPPPPPFPPPPPAPTARASRQQRRAVHLAARQQRALQRVQERTLRRHSLLGPILLTALGATLLLQQIGHFPATALVAWLGQWWPLLLLAAGFLRLAEWSWDHRAVRGSGVDVLPRRRLGPGSLLLLVLVILFGLSAHMLQRGLTWATGNGNASLVDGLGLDRLLAQHAEDTEHLDAAMPPGATFTVQNDAGSVTIRGSSQDGHVHILAEQHFSAWQSAELQSHRQRDRPSLRGTATGMALTVAAENRDRTDLTIELPRETAVVVQAGQGDLSLAELHASTVISNHQGSLVLTALTGPIQVHIDDEDAAITGHSLSGNIQIDGRAGDLDFSDISGSLSLQGDFFGNTHLARIGSPVHFKSNFTDLSCAAIPGNLLIGGRTDFKANDITGPVILATSNRNLEITSLHGKSTITDRDGEVHLSLAGPVAPTTVTTSNAEIEVLIPKDLSFQLHGTTTNAEIITDYGLAIEHQGDRQSVSGNVHGEGPELQLSTTNANLSIRRSTSDPDTGDEERSGKRSDPQDEDD